jgi:hypothetical protein
MELISITMLVTMEKTEVTGISLVSVFNNDLFRLKNQELISLGPSINDGQLQPIQISLSKCLCFTCLERLQKNSRASTDPKCWRRLEWSLMG